VAVELAGLLRITVISADSRQVYRQLDIGTAKPTPDQLQRVEHLGIDIVDPGQAYSAGRFGLDAARWLETARVNSQPVVVGGTGFYVRALADGLFQEPALDPERRERLREWTASASSLGRWAQRLDPEFVAGGRQRAARSVEIGLLTGRPLSWWQREAKAMGAMRPWYVRLTLPRPVLHERIGLRCEQMLEAGLVSEVETLLNKGVPRGARGLDAVGYPDVIDHLDGRIQATDLAGAITTSTRQYAKRQETWFRHQLGAGPVLVLDATEDPATVAERIFALWEKRDERCESD
jgi:tRNA dimethylallyltransferase